MRYKTHFNGGKLFEVDIENPNVTVYDIYSSKNKPVYKGKFEKIFIGMDKNLQSKGNSILIDKGDGRYIFIGDKIYEFILPKHHEKISRFNSGLDQSDIPYPVAYSRNYAYFLANHAKYLHIEDLNFKGKKDSLEAYKEFYNLEKCNVLGKTRVRKIYSNPMLQDSMTRDRKKKQRHSRKKTSKKHSR